MTRRPTLSTAKKLIKADLHITLILSEPDFPRREGLYEWALYPRGGNKWRVCGSDRTRDLHSSFASARRAAKRAAARLGLALPDDA